MNHFCQPKDLAFIVKSGWKLKNMGKMKNLKGGYSTSLSIKGFSFFFRESFDKYILEFLWSYFDYGGVELL